MIHRKKLRQHPAYYLFFSVLTLINVNTSEGETWDRIEQMINEERFIAEPIAAEATRDAAEGMQINNHVRGIGREATDIVGDGELSALKARSSYLIKNLNRQTLNYKTNYENASRFAETTNMIGDPTKAAEYVNVISQINVRFASPNYTLKYLSNIHRNSIKEFTSVEPKVFYNKIKNLESSTFISKKDFENYRNIIDEYEEKMNAIILQKRHFHRGIKYFRKMIFDEITVQRFANLMLTKSYITTPIIAA